MASFTAGTTFVDGVSNDVTAAKLGALVTNATPTSGFIQDRTAETVTATNDTLLIGDASDSNNLKRITVANFAQTLPTAKVTTGTIDTGTFGTTTSTAATITTGTIPTLTTGTTTSTNEVVTNGTITNLSATTSTFLGTITGSTNVVNIGSGQIYKDSSGNVGIGSAGPNAKLEVKTAVAKATTAETKTINLSSSDASNALTLELALGTNSTAASRYASIQSVEPGVAYRNLLLNKDGGNVCVNRTSGDGKFNTDGSVYFYNFTAGVGNSTIKYNSGTGQLFYDTSSLRYKKNIRDSSYGLDSVTKMRSVQYEYKDSNYSDVGIIAEELEAIIPELVGKNADGQPESVLYDRLTSVLIKAVQELKTENDSLKSRIEALEAK